MGDGLTGAQYRRGELLVQFANGVTEAVRTQTMAAAHASGTLQVLPGGWELVATQFDTTALSALSVLSADRSVKQVSLNYRRTTQQRPNDDLYRLQWNFDAIDMPKAWEINPGGTADVTVAVIDTGLNTETGTFVFNSPFVGRVPIRFAATPDLVSDGRIVKAFDFVYGDKLPFDLDGHGTHVAGTIGQSTNNARGLAGVAYNVRLMPLKVLPADWDRILLSPVLRGGSDDVVARGIRYAADNGAQVINLSLGGPGASPLLRDAIQYAVNRGAFVAIAAGNAGEFGNPVEYRRLWRGNRRCHDRRRSRSSANSCRLFWPPLLRGGVCARWFNFRSLRLREQHHTGRVQRYVGSIRSARAAQTPAIIPRVSSSVRPL